MNSTETHLILGAGQVGAGLAALLLSQGLRVLILRRSDRPVPAGVELMVGDVRDPAVAARAGEGVAVVYHCMNPSEYSGAAWEEQLPAMGEGAIAAARASGAKLVCLDNLYGYGPTEGPRTEQSPAAATGRKARVRVRWEERLRREPGLRFVLARAGDFFGPGCGEQSLFAPARLGAWTGPLLLADPSAPHAFSYVPDVVAGLAALGRDEGSEDIVHLPVHTLPPRELVARIAQVRGASPRFIRLPGWLCRALAPVVPLLSELGETWYQWDRPFLVDDSRFRARFPGVGVSLDEAVRATSAGVTS